MKLFKRQLIHTLLVFFLLLTNNLPALSQTQKADSYLDSVEVSLLTCGPRPYVYSLYGHTAIRYNDRAHGTDLAVNYGMFSFGKPFFVLRFVFGLTDYEMGMEYFSDFVSNYAASGCGIRQQVLNLTNEEKKAIADAIYTNYEPQNRVYRYNYFYDNCTTRARDIILSHIKGKVTYHNKIDSSRTFRQMIHEYNETHRWARFGNDLLLGIKADQPTTREEQQFLPEHLANDFAKAEIKGNNNTNRPLVTSDTWVLPRTSDVGNDSFPLSPFACMLTIALTVVILTVIETLRKSNYWWLDLILLLSTGLCGLILLAMVFSQHPTVSLNLQILMLNPLSLFAIVPTIKSIRKGKRNWWIKTWCTCLLIFFIGGFFQDYAEGLMFVALSLLLRYGK